MTRSTKLTLAAVLALFVCSGPANPYPIAPLTLWELTEQADSIVLAEVESVQEPDQDGESRDSSADAVAHLLADAVAHLRVRERWKGPRVANLDVAFGPHVVCPAPPRFVAGKIVLAFLARSKSGWYTVGLSYGTLYPEAAELADLRHVVRQALAIQSGGSTAASKTDWMVDAASRPATRWHGLYGLIPQTDRLHAYYDRRVRPATNVLGGEQLKRIGDGFVREPPVDGTLPMALAVLAGYQNREVDEAAVSAIEALLAQDSIPWWVPDALAAVFRRFRDTAPERRVAALGDVFDEREAPQVRDVWRLAKTELAIPAVAPAVLHAPEVCGVGSNTPD